MSVTIDSAVSEIQGQRCPRCEQTLPLEAFPERYRGKPGNYCTNCSREYKSEYDCNHIPPEKPWNPFVNRLIIICAKEGCKRGISLERLARGADRCKMHKPKRIPDEDRKIRPAIPGGRPGGTTAKGYGSHHQRIKEQWRPRVEAGIVDCWRCGERIPPRTQWDLGHKDGSRTEYRGPEHRACNRATKRLDRVEQPLKASGWWE